MIVKFYGRNGLKAKIKFKNLRERTILEHLLEVVSKPSKENKFFCIACGKWYDYSEMSEHTHFMTDEEAGIEDDIPKLKRR